MLTYSGRKLVLTYQLLQLVDAALVGLGFWLAAEARNPVRELFHMPGTMGRSMLTDMSWVLYLAVPFTPLVLEYFGFYQEDRQKSGGRALLQVAKALAVIGLVLALISFFARVQDASRLILLLAAPIVGFLLLIRDGVTRWRRAATAIQRQD